MLILNSFELNGNFIIGWVFLLEFIFTLALALKCYPLQPGGLLALQAIVLGLTTTKHVFYEIENNLEGIIKFKDISWTKKEVQDFCSKYTGVTFSDASKVPLAGTFKSDGPSMTRSQWQKTLIEKGYFARSIPRTMQCHK